MNVRKTTGIIISAAAAIILIGLVVETWLVYNGQQAPVLIDNQLPPQAKPYIPASMINLLYWGEFAAIIGILCFPLGYVGTQLRKEA